MKKRGVLFLLLLLGVAGYFLWDYWSKSNAEKNRIQASGTIETTEVQVGSRVGGRVIRVLAKEGDKVQEGQRLVVLDPYQWPSQREALEAQLAQGEARLEALRRGPRAQEIAAAEAQYREAQQRANLIASGARQEDIAQAAANRRQAEADLENARATYQRMQNLLSRRVISQQEFDNAQAAFRSAQERVNAALQREQELRAGNRPQEIAAAREQAQARREQLNLLRAGTRPEEIAAQEAANESIRAQIKQLDKALEELAVTSPCPCEVSSMDIRPGQLILPNQTLVTLTNLDDLWVRVYIPEERFGQVQPGDTAEVRVDAFPNRTFRGKVVQLATRAEFTPRNVQTPETRRIQVFGVKVALDNRERLLRPGMPADVTFRVNRNQPSAERDQ